MLWLLIHHQEIPELLDISFYPDEISLPNDIQSIPLFAGQ